MKLYRRMLASYLLAGLIPLLLSLFTTIRLESIIQDTMLEDKETTVENIQREIDQNLQDAINTAGLLAADTTLTGLAGKYVFTGEDMMNQRDIVNLFARSRQQQQTITHAFVYFFRSGRLVSESRGYSKPVTDMYAKTLDVPYAFFYDAIQDSSGLCTVQPLSSTDGVSYLLVTYNIYADSYTNKLATVGLLLRISQNLIQWEDENSEVFLIQDGVKIYGSARATEAVRQMGGGDSGITLTLDGEKYVCSFQVSGVCDITFGFLTRQSEYYQSVRLLQGQLVLEIIIYIFFGIFASIFFSRRTWSPFQKILDFVGARCTGNAESFESVQRALQSLADEKDILENRLREETRQAHRRYISRFLLGFSSDSSALSQYIEDGQPYRLLLFSLIRPEESEFFKNVPRNRYAETLEMLYFAVRNILEEILLESRDGVSVMIEDCIVLVAQDSLPGGLMDELEHAVKTTETALSLSMACYVGPACRHLDEGPAAWKQVQQLYRESGFWQKDRLPGVWETPQAPASDGPNDYPAHTRALAACLSEGNFAGAEKIFEGILQHDLDGHFTPGQLIRYRLAGMTELLAAYLPEGSENYLRQMIVPGPVEDKRQLLRDQFAAVRLAAGQEEPVPGPDKNTLWAETVRQYIEENFQNPSLNASMIADHLGLSLSALSRRFKAAAGHGVLDEIHLVRLREAKELLKGGLTVRETAEKTGYIESRAMIRAFKRYEGITPGQYVGKE